jgi:hypothetical protein
MKRLMNIALTAVLLVAPCVGRADPLEEMVVRRALSSTENTLGLLAMLLGVDVSKSKTEFAKKGADKSVDDSARDHYQSGNYDESRDICTEDANASFDVNSSSM